jgi:hypothetical protein
MSVFYARFKKTTVGKCLALFAQKFLVYGKCVNADFEEVSVAVLSRRPDKILFDDGDTESWHNVVNIQFYSLVAREAIRRTEDILLIELDTLCDLLDATVRIKDEH